MKIMQRIGWLCALATPFLLGAPLAIAQCVSLTTLGAAAAQNFDTLANTGTTNNLTITGWFLTESGGGARDNEQYATDTGASNTGDTYSYGAAAATERALGGLQSGTLIPVFGACYTNNTGSIIGSLAVAYTGEEWRLGTAARTDQINFEYSLNATDLVTGTWSGVAALNFVTPDTATVGAKNGNAASSRTALSSTISALSIANGATFWIRWTDTNASGADDGLSVDDFSLTPNGAVVTPNLSINDVSQAEGNAGTTTFAFTVGLSAPAGAGGVTFDIATTDNTATLADNDYVLNSLTGQTIPAGGSTYSFNVTVNGDTTPESNEIFFVNVSNVTGATVTDGQGSGTINNDDVALTPIHDIQGTGSSSPLSGVVTTRGIVTAVVSNGFFIQEPDASVDADPLTSEAVLVFTSAAPPAAAAVGNLVQVSGTITEFVPSQDSLQPPLTELTSPTVTLVSSGNPLPAAVPLTATFPDSAGTFDQLERLEAMRVSVASLSVVAPTTGSINEPNATATSNGVFHAVVTGNARPLREPGIQAPDPAPAGTIPPIPRWDSNPEVLRLDSDRQIGAALVDVSTGAVVSGVVGVLDYAFRRYTILPDPSASIGVAGGATARAVTVPGNTEFTVASYNLLRFFDTVDDPGITEPVLTATAFNNRLAKASLAIRNFLRTPDILAVVEVENLTTLQALAARISADAIAASQPDPLYNAFLVEGNDVGGIDIGFLIKTAVVVGATPRVAVTSVTQEGLATLFVNPDASTELLNDRPSLVLQATINHPLGASFPITVIGNHLRSLNGVDSPAPGANGWATAGERVRAKRLAQAAFLANLVQARQTTTPTERIALVGDFNAFEFNDGLVDSINVIAGTPVPDNQTSVPGDGVDLVNPDFSVLQDVPAERYSFNFGGNAQAIDHALINAPLTAATSARRVEHARINSDFAQVAINGTTDALRGSDHDPLVAYFTVAAFGGVDLQTTLSDNPDPVIAGNALSYTGVLTNASTGNASNVNWNLPLPSATTFLSLTAPAGWSCTTPAVGATGTVNCSIASLGPGAVTFDLGVIVTAGTAAGTILSATAAVSATEGDPVPADNSATSTTTVAATRAEVSVLLADAPDPATAGGNLTYTVTATNEGPSSADNATVTLALPTEALFQSFSSPAGWSCTTPAVGSSGSINCSIASFAIESAVFTAVTQIAAGTANGAVISANAAITATTGQSNTSNDTATASTTVNAPVGTQFLLAITDTPDPVVVGNDISYAISLTSDLGDLSNASARFTLPPQLSFVSMTTAAPFACTTPAVGSSGVITCNNALPLLPAATYNWTLVATAASLLPAGTTVTLSGTASAEDSGRPVNSNASASTTVISPATLASSKTLLASSTAPGAAISYEILIVNSSTNTQGNYAGDEFIDVLPAGLTLNGATANVGTITNDVPGNSVRWNGTLAAAQSATITINALINASVPLGTLIANQATVNFDADGNGSNEATALSDDPATGAANDATQFQVLSPATLSATKRIANVQAIPGGNVQYQIVVTNAGPSTQFDGTGDEVIDILPAQLNLLSANASQGTITTDIPNRTVRWNGALAASASVTLTINASIATTAAAGLSISNQATLLFDGNGDGINEAAAVSDDPLTNPMNDPSVFVLGALTPVPILSLSGLALMLMLFMAVAYRAQLRSIWQPRPKTLRSEDRH